MSSTSSTVDDDDEDECCWQRDRLAVAKFSKSGVWDKVPEGSTLILGDTHISLQHIMGQVEGRKPHAKNQLDSSSRFDTIPAYDRRAEGRTDGHDDSTYCASIVR